MFRHRLWWFNVLSSGEVSLQMVADFLPPPAFTAAQNDSTSNYSFSFYDISGYPEYCEPYFIYIVLFYCDYFTACSALFPTASTGNAT